MSNTAKQPETPDNIQICCYMFGKNIEKEPIYEAGENGELEAATKGTPIIETTTKSHRVEIGEDGKTVSRIVLGKATKLNISVEEAKRRISEKGIRQTNAKNVKSEPSVVKQEKEVKEHGEREK